MTRNFDISDQAVQKILPGSGFPMYWSYDELRHHLTVDKSKGNQTGAVHYAAEADYETVRRGHWCNP